MDLTWNIWKIVGALLLFTQLSDAIPQSCDLVCVSEVYNTNQNKWCQAKYASSYPWTTSESVTAPRPESFNVTVGMKKIASGKNHICLKTIWKQKVSDLKLVNGYVLNINMLKPHGSGWNYIVDFNKSLSNYSSVYAIFKFDYCGDCDHFTVEPENEFSIELQAMPIYREKDDKLELKQEIHVPSCKGRKITKSEECRQARKQEKRLRKEERKLRKKRKPPRPSKLVEPGEMVSNAAGMEKVYYVLTAVSCLLIPVVFWLLYKLVTKQKLCRTRGKTNVGKSEIVVIATLRKRYIETTNRIIDALRGCPNLHVLANIRSKVDIGKMGLVEWCEDSMNNADVIVFLIADLDEVLDLGEIDITDTEKLLNQNETTTAVTVAKNIAAKKSSSKKKKFLYVSLNEQACTNKLTFCQHYNMPRDWKLLSKRLFADSPIQLYKNDIKIIQNLLENLQLGYNAVLENSREDIAPVDDNQNDLDSPITEIIHNPCHSQMPTLNIIQDGHPSHVSNASYITTDLNISPSIESSTNYSHTGARPKV